MFEAHGRGLAMVLWLTTGALVACGSSTDDAGSASNAAQNGAGSGAGNGSGEQVIDPPSGSGDGGAKTFGSETLCNGIDDDGNGIIDDVDVGKDGICDCLKIATLGITGTWGQGDVFASWLSSRSNFGAQDLGNQVLTPELLAPLQVIVAQDVSTIGRSYAPAEVTALNDWINNVGGGFMTLIGYASPSEVDNVNLLLQPMGMNYGNTQILAKPKGGSTIPITNWIAHPVTQGVSRIGMDNGYEVQGGGTVLATEQGHDILRVMQPGKGHALMWGDEWITYNSEWSDHPDYQVQLFWINMIKWLTPTNVCQVPIPATIK